MNARHWLVLAAAVALLAAAAVGTLAALLAAGALTLVQPGTYQRRSTIAVPGATGLPTRAGDGPHPEGAR